MLSFFQKKNAFTLVELIIVITVIGVLTGGAALSLTSHAKQARDTRRKTDLQQIKSALEFYRADQPNGFYPTALSALVPTQIEVLPVDPALPSTTLRGYRYVPQPTGCNNTAVFCTSYFLIANTEATNIGAGGTGHYTVSPLSVD